MAIGIPLPPPQVPRLRLPWRDSETAFARPALILKAGVLSAVSSTRVLWRRLVNAAQSIVQLRARARQRQRARLNVFEDHYERLIDVLCASAHEGIRPDRERTYARLRTWMLVHYPCLAPQVHRHWRVEGPASDPFVALFRQSSLADAVNREAAIEDIMRSREALAGYRSEIESSV